jgi:tripartite-type tricarboxylate transporter receptor subunit TctC
MKHLIATLGATLAALVTCSAPALAQADYPNQPIKWVVPYPAGGGTDIFARTLADSMKTTLGQQLIIDNKPGASTNIGAEYTAHSKPDGYTIMSGDNASMAFNEHLFKKLPYNPSKDFTYIGSIGRWPLVLVVNPNVPVKTVKEFIDYVNANPGKVDYASPGNGSPHHMGMEIFKQRTGIKVQHIPYKGAAPALQDLVGGQVPAMFLDLASGLGLMKAGKVRMLAIAAPKRAAIFPDVPTMAEAGVKDMEAYAFQGLLGPAGLPPAIVTKLNTALNAALKDPVVVGKFNDFGTEIQGGTPEAFFQYARGEANRWGPVIKTSGIQLD